jgi:hypothetical protein
MFLTPAKRGGGRSAGIFAAPQTAREEMLCTSGLGGIRGTVLCTKHFNLLQELFRRGPFPLVTRPFAGHSCADHDQCERLEPKEFVWAWMWNFGSPYRESSLVEGNHVVRMPEPAFGLTLPCWMIAGTVSDPPELSHLKHFMRDKLGHPFPGAALAGGGLGGEDQVVRTGWCAPKTEIRRRLVRDGICNALVWPHHPAAQVLCSQCRETHGKSEQATGNRTGSCQCSGVLWPGSRPEWILPHFCCSTAGSST